MNSIKSTAFRRCLFLFAVLFLGLCLSVYEVVHGELPARGFGIVLLLLIVAFLAGMSLILHTAARQTREHLSAPASPALPVQATSGTSSEAEAALTGVRPE